MCVLYVQYTIYAIMQCIIKMLRLECRLIYRVPSPDNDLYVQRTGFCEQRREIESSLNLLKRLPIYRLWVEPGVTRSFGVLRCGPCITDKV
jgi:hypothetical protein